MSKVLVSNNVEILRHLASENIAALNLELSVVSDATEAMHELRSRSFDLVIIDAELPDSSGYEVARWVKRQSRDCKVVLVMSGRINAAQMRKVAESGCDEVVIAPMGADELYDVVATVLGLERVGAKRYEVKIFGVQGEESRLLRGRVISLSVDGVRLVITDPVSEADRLRLDIGAQGDAPVSIEAAIVWLQQGDEGSIVAAAFDQLDDHARGELARLTEWEVVQGGEKTRVVLKGGITEASNFKNLLPSMVGRVDFDLSQVGYMNSLGAREWVQFLRDAAIRGYEFHACSVPFVLQASSIEGMLGRGTVASFFAPYSCEGCGHQEDRLLQSAAVLASESGEAPTFSCPECNDELILDELPERYLAFLRGEVK